MIYKIENKKLTVSIDTKGAQMVSAFHNRKERLWQNSDGSWADHAPVLFPICGRCAVLINGVDYNMPFHGFVLNSEFSVIKKTEKSISLQIQSNENTKKIYPYDFSFIVIYKVKFNKVVINYIVKNLSNEEMYFSCGAHDSFVVDNALEDYSISFNKKENLLAYFDDEGVLTDKTKQFSDNKKIDILGSGLANDGSLIFKNIKSNKITLLNENKKIVKISFNKLHHLVLWRTKNNDMICIEPWGNLPDSLSDKSVEFRNKDGVIKIKGKKEEKIKRSIRYY